MVGLIVVNRLRNIYLRNTEAGPSTTPQEKAAQTKAKNKKKTQLSSVPQLSSTVPSPVTSTPAHPQEPSPRPSNGSATTTPQQKRLALKIEPNDEQEAGPSGQQGRPSQEANKKKIARTKEIWQRVDLKAKEEDQVQTEEIKFKLAKKKKEAIQLQMLLLIKNKKLRAKKLQETVEETTTQLSNEMNEMNDSLAQGLNRIDQEYLTQQEELKKHL